MNSSYLDYVRGVATFGDFRERMERELAEDGHCTLYPGDSFSAAALVMQGRVEEAEDMFWYDLRALHVLEVVPGLRTALRIYNAKLNVNVRFRDLNYRTIAV